MNELIKKRLEKSIGKRCEIFLNNGFRYAGTITNCDETWLELLEERIQGYKLIRISDINNADIIGEGKNEDS